MRPALTLHRATALVDRVGDANGAGGLLLVTLLRIVRTGELFKLRRRRNEGRNES